MQNILVEITFMEKSLGKTRSYYKRVAGWWYKMTRAGPDLHNTFPVLNVLPGTLPR